VPVNFSALRKPKRDMIWVALAGPASNFIQALLWGIVYTLLVGFDINERFFLEMCKAGVLVNLVMAAFNLFPLPPLDGGRVLVGLLPRRQAYAFSKIEPYGFFIVMALVIFHVVGDYWLSPLISLGYVVLDLLLSPLNLLFH